MLGFKFISIRLFVIIIGCVGIVHAQQVLDNNLIEKLEEHNDELNNIVITQNIKYYDSHDTINIREEDELIITRKGDFIHYKYTNQETFIDNETIVDVDISNKIVTVTPSEKGFIEEAISTDIKGLLQEAKSVIKSVKKQNTTLEIIYEYGELVRLDLSFDNHSYLIKSMILYMINEDVQNRESMLSRMDIEYSNYDFNPIININDVKKEKVLKKQRNQYILNEQFGAYKLLDLSKNEM